MRYLNAEFLYIYIINIKQKLINADITKVDI